MFLPWGYDFVMWGCSLTLLFAYTLGPSFYVTPIFGLTPTHWLELTLYISGVCSSHTVIAWNIYKWEKISFLIIEMVLKIIYYDLRSYRDKTGQMRPFVEAAKPLFPLIGLFFVSTTWAYFSPNNILEYDPRIFFMITGTIFSNFSVRFPIFFIVFVMIFIYLFSL